MHYGSGKEPKSWTGPPIVQGAVQIQNPKCQQSPVQDETRDEYRQMGEHKETGRQSWSGRGLSTPAIARCFAGIPAEQRALRRELQENKGAALRLFMGRARGSVGESTKVPG